MASPFYAQEALRSAAVYGDVGHEETWIMVTDEGQKLGYNFRFSKNLYEEKLREGVESAFSPARGLVLSLPLPFQLPFKDGTLFSTLSSDISTVFIFEKYEVDIPVPYGHSPAVTTKFLRTRVELIAVVATGSRLENVEAIADLKDEAYQAIYEHFHHLVARLNSIIYSYRSLFEDSKTHSVQLEQYFLVSMALINLPDWRLIDSAPFIVNPNPANYENIMFNLPEKWATAVASLGFKMSSEPGRFTSTIQFYAESRRHLHRGEYREALIFLGLCAESYLNGVYYYVLAAEGMDAERIEDTMENTPFMSRVKKKLCQSFGGNWDLTDRSGSIGAWYEYVHTIRGRVVHGGYLPNVEEAWKAFEVVSGLDGFLRQHIGRRKIPGAFDELALLPRLFVAGEEMETSFSVD